MIEKRFHQKYNLVTSSQHRSIAASQQRSISHSNIIWVPNSPMLLIFWRRWAILYISNVYNFSKVMISVINYSSGIDTIFFGCSFNEKYSCTLLLFLWDTNYFWLQIPNDFPSSFNNSRTNQARKEPLFIIIVIEGCSITNGQHQQKWCLSADYSQQKGIG